MADFGMKAALKVLGIQAVNAGVGTGTKWIKSKGPVIESYSPVDGKLIGKITFGSNAPCHAT